MRGPGRRARPPGRRDPIARGLRTHDVPAARDRRKPGVAGPAGCAVVRRSGPDRVLLRHRTGLRELGVARGRHRHRRAPRVGAPPLAGRPAGVVGVQHVAVHAPGRWRARRSPPPRAGGGRGRRGRHPASRRLGQARPPASRLGRGASQRPPGGALPRPHRPALHPGLRQHRRRGPMGRRRLADERIVRELVHVVARRRHRGAALRAAHGCRDSGSQAPAPRARRADPVPPGRRPHPHCAGPPDDAERTAPAHVAGDGRDAGRAALPDLRAAQPAGRRGPLAHDSAGRGPRGVPYVRRGRARPVID